jgi:hypothetical protein
MTRSGGSDHDSGTTVPIRWEDMRFPASAFNPPGEVSDPGYDTTNGGFLFDAAGTEVLFMQAQLPHTWKEDTVLKPHVHWQKTTSATGTVYWKLEYKWCPIGEVMDAAFTTLFSTTPAVSDDDTANKHALTALGEISGTGKTISDMLIMKLSRVGASDTYGADARLIEFDIHYQIDGDGSRQEYIK